MKRILLLIFVSFLCKFTFSQDQLFKKDNTKQEVKILEVTPTEVKYKLFSNPDGPLYIINKSDVALIIYKNGEHEAFKDAAPKQQIQPYAILPYNMAMDSFRIKKELAKAKRFEEAIKNKNIAFINSLGFLNSCFSASYYHEEFNGLLGVHVPVSFSYDPLGLETTFLYSNGYAGISNYKINQKSIDLGLGLYIHTSGKKLVTHFIGPLIRFAQYNGTFETYLYTYYTNTYGTYSSVAGTVQHGFVMNQTYCMLNNGILFRVTPQFNMMLHAAIGFASNRRYVANDPKDFADPNSIYYSGYSYGGTPIFNFGFQLGYRF